MSAPIEDEALAEAAFQQGAFSKRFPVSDGYRVKVLTDNEGNGS